ncbi:MAG: cysteine--tRNA ligase [Bacteroidetes bacterium]|nr:MAG: cysteine--tRNA ligase [Bacteroidota bacterium]
MQNQLKIYNSLSRKKELFQAINPPFVGMYVCGPTVYSDVHLGNCRTFTSFDIIYRYLRHLGYQVRYVRNITDVGHLTGDSDEGEDKISKKAKLENLEPMEIVQKYTVGLHEVMQMLNNLPPNIEPSATGHLMEQIEATQKIVKNGFAYEVNGSVYFDVESFSKQHKYGELSGRTVEDQQAGYRTLTSQDEKRNPEDFALWKNASKEHLMKWESPWGIGFPGWHIECSAMSSKYLGKQFDIHGGGLDLKFPHHECEIAQSVAQNGEQPVKYWLHANMLTINGQKMSKSLGNSILPHELFSGNHALLDQGYSAMTLRFFMLQTHYRSTMDITNDALKAARKTYKKVMNGLRVIKQMQYKEDENIEKNELLNAQIRKFIAGMYEGMDDDFNTAKALASLFEILKKINSLHTDSISISALENEVFLEMKTAYLDFIENIFGLKEEQPAQIELVEALLQIYREAKQVKNYGQVDAIRSHLKSVGIVVKDMKNRIEWEYEE